MFHFLFPSILHQTDDEDEVSWAGRKKAICDCDLKEDKAGVSVRGNHTTKWPVNDPQNEFSRSITQTIPWQGQQEKWTFQNKKKLAYQKLFSISSDYKYFLEFSAKQIRLFRVGLGQVLNFDNFNSHPGSTPVL